VILYVFMSLHCLAESQPRSNGWLYERNCNIPQNVLLMLAAGGLGKVDAHTLVADPENVLWRFMPR
jgi:hypothetical protein